MNARREDQGMLAQTAVRMRDAMHARGDAVTQVAYGFFLGFAGVQWYSMLVLGTGTTLLFGALSGAFAGVLLSENLVLMGRLRDFEMIVGRRMRNRPVATRVFLDLIGAVVLLSMGLHLFDYPIEGRGAAAHTIAFGLAIVAVPTAGLIALVRLLGVCGRILRAAAGAMMSIQSKSAPVVAA